MAGEINVGTMYYLEVERLKKILLGRNPFTQDEQSKPLEKRFMIKGETELAETRKVLDDFFGAPLIEAKESTPPDLKAFLPDLFRMIGQPLYGPLFRDKRYLIAVDCPWSTEPATSISILSLRYINFQLFSKFSER